MFFEVSFCRNCCEASIFGKGNESFLTRSLGFLPLFKKNFGPLTYPPSEMSVLIDRPY